MEPVVPVPQKAEAMEPHEKPAIPTESYTGHSDAGLADLMRLMELVHTKVTDQAAKLDLLETRFTRLEQTLSPRCEQLKSSTDALIAALAQTPDARVQGYKNTVEEAEGGIADTKLLFPLKTCAGFHESRHLQHSSEGGEGGHRSRSTSPEKSSVSGKTACEGREDFAMTHPQTSGIRNIMKDVYGKLNEIKEDTLTKLSAQMSEGFQGLKEAASVQIEAEKNQFTEVKTAVDSSREVITNALEEARGSIVHDLGDDISKKLSLGNKELNKAIHGARQDGQEKMEEVRVNIRADVDKQIQNLSRDICDVVDKEAQLTRDTTVLSGVFPYKKLYEFVFPVRHFEQRLKTGVEVYSCPWHLPQLDSCLKGFATFKSDGTIEISLVDGRYPKIVGLEPKPKRTYSYRVSVVDGANNAREKLVGEASNIVFDESVQMVGSLFSVPYGKVMRTGGCGRVVGSKSCRELKEEGFAKFNELLVKYVINL